MASSSSSSIQDIADNLSACVYHLNLAGEAFSRVIQSISSTIDTCATASNGGNSKLGNSSVMWNELSTIRGLDIDISKLTDFGQFLSSDVVSVLEDTSRLASSFSSSSSSGVSNNSAAALDDRLLQAATVSSVLSNLMRLLTEFSKRNSTKDLERNILSLRQAKPFLIQFCTQPFGEFHRLLVSQDDGRSIASGAVSPLSSQVAAPAKKSATAPPPPLVDENGVITSNEISSVKSSKKKRDAVAAPTMTTTMAGNDDGSSTPQAQIAPRQTSIMSSAAMLSVNDGNNNNDHDETASNHSKTAGKKKKGGKKKKKHAVAGQEEEEIHHDENASQQQQQDLLVDNENNMIRNNNNNLVSPSNPSQSQLQQQQQAPQLISNQTFSFVNSFQQLQTGGGNYDSSSLEKLFLQFDGRGIDTSLPTSVRSKYASVFSNFISPISSLMSSRETFLSDEAALLPLFGASSAGGGGGGGGGIADAVNTNKTVAMSFVLDVVQKALCDAVIDTEIGLELGLGISLSKNSITTTASSASAAMLENNTSFTSSSDFSSKQQQKVSEWKFPLSSSSSSSSSSSTSNQNNNIGFGIKEIPLSGNSKNKWISIFAVFFSTSNQQQSLSFIRQDAFIRGSSVIEVGIEVALQYSSSSDEYNCSFKPCLRNNASSGGNDPVGLAFIGIMKDVFTATANQVLPEYLSKISHAGKKKNSASKNNNNNLLSLDAKSHQERERKAQQEFLELQKQEKIVEENRIRQEQEEREKQGGIIQGTTNVIRGVGSTVFGVVKGVVMAPVTVAGAVADVAANTVKDQQLAVFRRNFPEFLPTGSNSSNDDVTSVVLDFYNCALDDGAVPLKQGYLYLLKDCCCFCGSVTSAKFTVRWRDISSLEKRKYAVMFNNSIELMLLNGKSYFLTSFLNRDAALNRIFDFWTGRAK